MPKIKVKHDEPTWDDLVAELGDPRPYQRQAIALPFTLDVDPWFNAADFELHERHVGELPVVDNDDDDDDDDDDNDEEDRC